MPDYKETYIKMFRASEKALDIIIAAQQECEKLYTADSPPELKVVSFSTAGGVRSEFARSVNILGEVSIMKIEIEKEFPQYFKPAYPEEFELFSHFETSAAIPQVLFAITTWKENGKPNVCLHSWSCFHGDKTAFFAVMGGLDQHTHTFENIKREKCFCINFLPIHYYDKLIETINHNEFETDEFQAGDFSLANAKTIHAPVIKESFMNMECTLKDIQDLSGAGITAMIIGEVQHVSVEEKYAYGYKMRYGRDGFMLLIPAPQNLITGEPEQPGIAIVDIQKLD